MSRDKRLTELSKIPVLAAMDHRMFRDESGRHPIEKLPRREKRKISKESRKLAMKYVKLMEDIDKSGAKYPVDRLIRYFALEYNNRYASSGIMTQPVSFNYFEPFYSIRLFDQTYAPHLVINSESNHLFSVPDFFDFLTSEYAAGLSLDSLTELDEGHIYNFTQNGSISDFSYMTAEGREFLISGFSMVRHGSSLHWFVLGGEMLSQEEWEQLTQLKPGIDISDISPLKRRFLQDNVNFKEGLGSPIAIDGTSTALKTIIAGETDLVTKKHLGRCYLTEHENSFNAVCDDPDVFWPSNRETDELALLMMQKIEAASVMWSLAEGLFHLLSYFKFRITTTKRSHDGNEPRRPRNISKKTGINSDYSYVKSLEIAESNSYVMRSYEAPRLPIETEGFWRRLKPKEWGRGRNGELLQGKTWVRQKNDWRERGEVHNVVYIKSTIESARVQIEDYIAAAEQIKSHNAHDSDRNVLYVLRCTMMKDEIYKVGWTSNTAQERAKELSSSTGVPSSFIVVAAWQHAAAEELEASIHARLAPYRVNAAREFFHKDFTTIKQLIEQEIDRLSK